MANELKQTSLDLTPGEQYQLTFYDDVTSGIIRVYQGTQLIYDTTIIPIQDKKDRIFLNESVTIERTIVAPLININNVISITENISISIF